MGWFSIVFSAVILIFGWMNVNVLGLEGAVSCLPDSMTLELPLEAAADHRLFVFDRNNKPIQIDPAYELKCQYTVEVLTVFQLRVGYGACEVQEQNKSLFLAVQISYFSKSLGQTVTKKYQMVCLPSRSDNLQISREVGKTRCTQSFMEVMLPQQLPNFDPISNTPQEWLVSINNGQTTTTMTLLQARSKGYEFTVANNLMIVRAYFTATGIQKFGRLQSDKVLYLADLTLTYDTGFGKITILVLMICVPAPVSCNRMNVLIEIPSFVGRFTNLLIGTRLYLPSLPSTDLAIARQQNMLCITVPKRYPLAQTMACPLGFLTGVKTVLPDTKLTFNVRGTLTSMTFTPVCPCEMKGSDPAVLCQDGFMDFEVSSNDTLPPLDLGTVQLRDPTCRPSVSSKDSLLFHVPLASCGTTSKVINGKLVYENEIRALLKDRPVLGVITRDSEYLLTVQCYYDHTADANLIVDVKTNAPPPPAMEQGDLIVVLRAYPDVLYRTPYRDQDYPVVRYLREPLYLEVQVLNRLDPNIKLVLDDCWATGFPSPSSLPRWNILVDGCPYDGDNYMTVFHPMSKFLGIPFPSHYRRFEVKMFTFVSGGVLQTNSIYFHCSTLICDLLKPDSDLCAKTCPSSASVKRRRGTMQVLLLSALPQSALVLVLTCDLVSGLGSAGSTAVLGEVVTSLPGPVAVLPEGVSTSYIVLQQCQVQTTLEVFLFYFLFLFFFYMESLCFSGVAI
ncbi:zona pellucida sperm-binding protein 2-like [Acipenser oxyrinchus oxyrinchus]|uniref:Zona pellucida sperm-binding protein 2-like n=1 Tax=Acipenser oxyrinchus oxyrinchus TaxID=40147 RepID=A0AAD8FMP8_ACIOX|nr:zona pellucida sperm-binding protein 2-like [Acipenser oxyrinchus oxyrinchus]